MPKIVGLLLLFMVTIQIMVLLKIEVSAIETQMELFDAPDDCQCLFVNLSISLFLLVQCGRQKLWDVPVRGHDVKERHQCHMAKCHLPVSIVGPNRSVSELGRKQSSTSLCRRRFGRCQSSKM